MKYTCVIIEDPSQEMLLLQDHLKSYFPEIQVLDVCDNIIESVLKIRSLKPKIVFLDAQLANSSNEMILRDLTQSSHVIFMSSHVENMVKAFKYSAFDFLHRPIIRNDLSRIIRKILWQENRMLRAKIRSLAHSDLIEKKVAIPSQDGIHLFPMDSIVRLKAERNYTRIHFTNKESMLTSKTLKSYEKMLPHILFQRVHQSHVLNLSKIKSYINRNGGYLLMEDGSTITISSRKKHQILEYLRGQVV